MNEEERKRIDALIDETLDYPELLRVTKLHFPTNVMVDFMILAKWLGKNGGECLKPEVKDRVVFRLRDDLLARDTGRK